MNAQAQSRSLRRRRYALAIASVLICVPSVVLAQPKPAAVTAPPAAPVEPAPATTAGEDPATSPVQPRAESTNAVVPAEPVPAVTPPSAAPLATEATPSGVAAPPEATVDSGAASDQEASEVTEELNGEAGKLNIYGFTDFTYSHTFSDRTSMNVPPAWYPSFAVGNFNLYLGADLGKNFHTLSEVRFTYLPDGAANYDYATNTATRVNSAYPDYSDYNRSVKVGGVIIERVWLEYAAHPLFTIRGGQWLTPYGIWNVEHGTTVIVGTTRPYVIGAELLPQHQTGLEAYGSYGVGSTQVGYHLTLSNGRGPVDTYRDLDKNKAIGWRLWVQQDTDFGTFTLGTSGYKGRYTDRMQKSTFVAGEIKYEYPTQSEYRELALALDLKWNWKGALFQGEAIMRDLVYENAARPAAQFPTQGWVPDTRNAGLYALGGYRFAWLGIMPFFGGEYYYLSKTSFVPDSMAVWGGINMRPTDRVVLKLQGTHSWYPSDWASGMTKTKPLNQLIIQTAWSF